ncbi:MAG: SDR family oxidoreductase [Pseudonocardiaceae bacterium]
MLITGCSSGFGLESALALARSGWRVFATMRNLDRRGPLEQAIEHAGARADGARADGVRADGARARVELLQLDVCDQGSIDRAVAQILARTGGTLHAVVHNAGIGDAGFFEDVPDEQVRRVMDTNFFGTLTLTRAVLPAMRAQHHGRVVVVSSLGAFTGQPAMSAYVASKWALEGWAESLAIEVTGFGIDIALIEPGAYKTGIWDAAKITSPEHSPYRPLVKIMEPRIRGMVERSAGDPAEVGARIAAVLNARRRPWLRHPVGRDAWIMRVLSRAIPFDQRRRILAHMVGLPADRPGKTDFPKVPATGTP